MGRRIHHPGQMTLAALLAFLAGCSAPTPSGSAAAGDEATVRQTVAAFQEAIRWSKGPPGSTTGEVRLPK